MFFLITHYTLLMTTKDPSREAHFPAIEKKYGEKMSYWYKVMAALDGQKYPEQIAYMRENFGFSQTHANALVMYSRGSKSARRFETPAQYFKSIDPKQAKTIKTMIKVINDKYPDLELVIAWNQPMLRIGTMYVFGWSITKNYILMTPWSADVLDAFRPKLTAFKVNKKTIAVPSDWEVDAKLLHAMAKARLAEG
jgi:uncharacterized protein YdhG (YjbR/CyaY superfamily)